MSETDVKKLWEEHWTEGASIEAHASWIGKRLRKRRLELISELLQPLSKNLSIVDMGCGGGRTLTVIRENGFKNSIGIDYSIEALKHCEEKGFIINKDVFLIDAKSTPYLDKHFGITFSEGLWEHFTNPEPFIDEQIRITNKYLIVIQPDHFSFFGCLLKIAWDMFASKAGGVKEYSFKIKYFIKYINNKGFKLIDRKGTLFNEQAVLLFQRVK